MENKMIYNLILHHYFVQLKRIPKLMKSKEIECLFYITS